MFTKKTGLILFCSWSGAGSHITGSLVRVAAEPDTPSGYLLSSLTSYSLNYTRTANLPLIVARDPPCILRRPTEENLTAYEVKSIYR